MKEYRQYLLHSFLRNFTQYTFFIFGALLIYEKTQSISITLVYYLLGNIASILTKSIFVQRYLLLVQKVGVSRVLATTLILGALSLVGVFFVNIEGYGLIVLMILGILYNSANSCYWILSNALYLSYAGSSDTPGKLTSYNFIVSISASVAVSVSAFVLHLEHNFLLLFLLMGVFLIASIYPLRFLRYPVIEPVSFKKCLARLSRSAFWSNVNPEHTLMTIGVPLITLSLFGSFGKSINISIVVALCSILLIYWVGKDRDKNSNRTVWPAFGIVISTAIAYAFIQTAESFIIIGIIYNLAYMVIDVARDASLSREVSNSQNSVQTTVVIEFARSLGGLIGSVVLLSTYLIFYTVWQPMLALGVLFIVPRAFYTLKNIVPLEKYVGFKSEKC